MTAEGWDRCSRTFTGGMRDVADEIQSFEPFIEMMDGNHPVRVVIEWMKPIDDEDLHRRFAARMDALLRMHER